MPRLAAGCDNIALDPGYHVLSSDFEFPLPQHTYSNNSEKSSKRIIIVTVVTTIAIILVMDGNMECHGGSFSRRVVLVKAFGIRC